MNKLKVTRDQLYEEIWRTNVPIRGAWQVRPRQRRDPCETEVVSKGEDHVDPQRKHCDR